MNKNVKFVSKYFIMEKKSEFKNLENYLFPIDIIKNLNIQGIQEFVSLQIDRDPNEFKSQNQNYLRGIIGFICISSIRFNRIPLFFPEILNLGEDELLQRLSNKGKNIDYYPFQTNSSSAMILRKYYKLLREVKRSIHYEDLVNNFLILQNFIVLFSETLDNNLIAHLEGEYQKINNSKLVKTRIKNYLLTYLHDADKNLGVLIRESKFSYKLNNCFFKGFTHAVSYMWYQCLTLGEWDKFSREILTGLIEVTSWEDYDAYFTKLLNLFPDLREYYITKHIVSYHLSSNLSRPPITVFDDKINIKLSLDNIFAEYPVQVVSRNNFIEGYSFWQVIFNGIVKLGEENNYKPKVIMFLEPSEGRTDILKWSKKTFPKNFESSYQFYIITLAVLLPSHGTFSTDASKWFIFYSITSNWLGDGFGECDVYGKVINDLHVNRESIDLKSFEVPEKELWHFIQNEENNRLNIINKSLVDLHSNLRGNYAEIISRIHLSNLGWNVFSNLKKRNFEIDILGYRKKPNSCEVCVVEVKEISMLNRLNKDAVDKIQKRFDKITTHNIKQLLQERGIKIETKIHILYQIHYFNLLKSVEGICDEPFIAIEKYLKKLNNGKIRIEVIGPISTRSWSNNLGFVKNLIKTIKDVENIYSQ